MGIAWHMLLPRNAKRPLHDGRCTAAVARQPLHSTPHRRPAAPTLGPGLGALPQASSFSFCDGDCGGGGACGDCGSVEALWACRVVRRGECSAGDWMSECSAAAGGGPEGSATSAAAPPGVGALRLLLLERVGEHTLASPVRGGVVAPVAGLLAAAAARPGKEHE